MFLYHLWTILTIIVKTYKHDTLIVGKSFISSQSILVREIKIY